MNNEILLLKETAKLKDIVDLGVCVAIYQTCNGRQFRDMPGSVFVNFMNLQVAKDVVCPLPRENQRICYMIYAVSLTITPANYARHWVLGVLEVCGIAADYYEKHHKDFLSVTASEKNKIYVEQIKEAIKRAL